MVPADLAVCTDTHLPEVRARLDRGKDLAAAWLRVVALMELGDDTPRCPRCEVRSPHGGPCLNQTKCAARAAIVGRFRCDAVVSRLSPPAGAPYRLSELRPQDAQLTRLRYLSPLHEDERRMSS